MLPDGFHQWFGGGGHIPVIDPGPAQDATLITCDIVSTFGPGGPIKAAQGARRIRAITTAAAVTSGPRKTRQISTATKVASGPRKQRIIKTAADEAAEKSARQKRAIEKPPAGEGQVPPSHRDPRRYFTNGEKLERLKQQGGACIGCDKPLDPRNARGHHRRRHADGGRTDSDNLDVLCPECHIDVHRP